MIEKQFPNSDIWTTSDGNEILLTIRDKDTLEQKTYRLHETK
jgi:hypothetical protein